MPKFALAALILVASAGLVRAEIDTSFSGFPEINVYHPGDPTYNGSITSDYITGLLRPKWTRAMTDVGGWPSMYTFKNDIYLEWTLVDGHRGAVGPGATGQLVRWRSQDQGNSW